VADGILALPPDDRLENSPNVPGCAAVGDTKEETRRNFQDALGAHFEVMREMGEPVPEPNSSVDYVEVAA
jgi:predicted RNase H-like HicB family nuclease